MKGLVVVVMSAATAWLSAGCDSQMCTLIGAPGGLNLDISLTDRAFDESVYELVVRAEGRELSIRDDNRPGGTCTATPQSEVVTDCYAEIDSESHTLMLNGSVWASGGSLVLEYRGDLGGPALAEVEVRRNDVALVTRTYTPTYEVVEPNGPGCGQSAYAFDSLTVVAP